MGVSGGREASAGEVTSALGHGKGIQVLGIADWSRTGAPQGSGDGAGVDDLEIDPTMPDGGRYLAPNSANLIEPADGVPGLRRVLLLSVQ